MTMPIDLVLVRHGESEGNIAIKQSQHHEDNSHYTPDFLQRPSSSWRLSEKGMRDAQQAGQWLKKHMPHFDRFYTSSYLRAMETAGLLRLKNARWRREFYLRERDRGLLDVIPYNERIERFSEESIHMERNSLFYAPPGGESLAAVCMRIDRVLDTLHRECSNTRVIIVCHGEVMWAFRLRLERMSQETWETRFASKNHDDTIYNGQIIHYTRKDPNCKVIHDHFQWLRMIRADDETFSRDWQTIERSQPTNDELLALVEKYPRLISK